MNDNLNFNKIEKEEGFTELRKHLKNLPQIRVPDDFEAKLHHRLSKEKSEKSISIWEKIFFPKMEYNVRVIIYSTVSVIALCSVFLVYFITRSYDLSRTAAPATIDSTVYDGKKVIILPPTSPEQSGQMGQQPLHDLVEPEPKGKIDKDNLDKYFAAPESTSDESNKVISTIVSDSPNQVLSSETKQKMSGAKPGAVIQKKKADSINTKKKLK